MPVWMIPLLMSMAGGAAGEAKGHNTKSALEGAGMGALLGTGIGAAGAGAAGAGTAAGADAGLSADALASTAAGSTAGDMMGAGDALASFGGTEGGATGLDLASLSQGAGAQGLAASGDAADMSMLGGGAQQGVGAADMGSFAAGTPGSTSVFMSTAPSDAGSFGAGASNPTSTMDFAGNGAVGNSQQAMYQKMLSNPQFQKYLGRANDMGEEQAIRSAMTPVQKTTTYGQPLLDGSMPAMQATPGMNLPTYQQQMQQLGFA